LIFLFASELVVSDSIVTDLAWCALILPTPPFQHYR
jgi:hypothetical protein